MAEINVFERKPAFSELTALEREDFTTKQLKYRMLDGGLYEIFYEGGGEVPDYLKGAFTSPIHCQRAIHKYING